MRRFVLPAIVAGIALFTSLTTAARARMDLPRPVFATPAEGYGSTAPFACVAMARAGTLAFGELIRAASGYSFGAARACNAPFGARESQHKAGRAVDVPINWRNAAQRADGEFLLRWLFESGAERLRRLGVVQVIWAARIWMTSRDSARPTPDVASWRRYTGLGCPNADDSACHYDHVHLTLSAAGSEKTSSWWTAVQGLATPTGPVPAVAIAPAARFAGIAAASARGYWLVERPGGVFSYGDAQFHGSWGGKPLAGPTIAIAATPTRNGYRLAATDGGVFAFGDATFHGSMAGRRLNAPVVSIAATPSGGGYWLASADGGVFAFGDAPFHGSMAGKPLNGSVVGIASTPTGRGYWLVAGDGGVFAFGDAAFFGSMASKRLNAPVVGMAPTPTGRGYWLVAGDGGVFAFGDAPFHGSPAGRPLGAPVVGIAPTPSGRGYWLAGGDGSVYAFSDAQFAGSAPRGSGTATAAVVEARSPRKPPPVIVTPETFHPVGTANPAGGAVVTYLARRSGRVAITIQRRRGRAYVTLRGQRSARARRGRNHYLYDGRLRGRPLAPGRYRLVISLRRATGRTVIGRDGFRIVDGGPVSAR